jgi:ABC-type Fe3+ transport system permease subunit
VNHATSAYSGSAASNQTLDIHARHSVPPSFLHAFQTSLLHGIHGAFIAALIAAILGFLVVLALPGGSAREHELRDTEEESPAMLEAREA